MNEYQLEAQRKYLVKLRKRKQREKSKLMRGNRSVFTILREKLKRNRYYEACTLDDSVKVTMLTPTPKMDNFGINASDVRARIDELQPANTDEWRSGGSFASVKPGIKFTPYVRRDE